MHTETQPCEPYQLFADEFAMMLWAGLCRQAFYVIRKGKVISKTEPAKREIQWHKNTEEIDYKLKPDNL